MKNVNAPIRNKRAIGPLTFVVSAMALLSAQGLSEAVAGPPLKTDRLGNVPVPSATILKEMQAGTYFLHARAGRLGRVSVEKVRLPGAKGEEGGLVTMGPRGSIYVGRKTLLCKSTDGGRHWTSYERAPDLANGFFKFLTDGTMIAVTQDRRDGQFREASRVHVWASADEGKTARMIGSIRLPTERFTRYTVFGLNLLSDGTLLCRVKLYGIVSSKRDTLMLYRSTDHGRNWQGPHKLADWCSQGDIVTTPSGNLLTTLRYQRARHTSDRPDTDRRGFKHLYLAESADKGISWRNLRPLTTVFGQCYGCPAIQRDGTVVVIHDTRYGPGHRGSRAMVSYDQGRNWADEVYYVSYTEDRAEPSFSVVLADDTILSIVGADTKWKGPIDLFAIRWKPVKIPK